MGVFLVPEANIAFMEEYMADMVAEELQASVVEIDIDTPRIVFYVLYYGKEVRAFGKKDDAIMYAHKRVHDDFGAVPIRNNEFGTRITRIVIPNKDVMSIHATILV